MTKTAQTAESLKTSFKAATGQDIPDEILMAALFIKDADFRSALSDEIWKRVGA